MPAAVMDSNHVPGARYGKHPPLSKLIAVLAGLWFFSQGQDAAKDKFISTLTDVAQKKAKKP